MSQTEASSAQTGIDGEALAGRIQFHEDASDPVVMHLPGCPGERFETFTAKRDDGRAFSVTRCQDCAAQIVIDAQTGERVIERVH